MSLYSDQASKKLKVGILCGGVSSEHEISLLSAQSILNAIDKNKFDVSMIGIDKNGHWLEYPQQDYLLNPGNPKQIALNAEKIIKPIKMLPEAGANQNTLQGKLDVIFPVLHGKNGEDGTVQGLLELANIPYVGSGVLASALCMDKDLMKRVLRDAKLPMADFISLSLQDYKNKTGKLNFENIVEKLGLPFFLKPANAGSSVGVHKVKNQVGFEAALEDAFKHDKKVILEEFITGREIECSVLGNENPRASLPGEVIVQGQHEFYSYDCKYLDDNGAKIEIPARLKPELVKRIQDLAIVAYQTLNCAGMARVDFFLAADETIYINELNTIPGFTKISMYPKMWEASGLSYGQLIEELIHLALDRERI
ncbi:MAG: D-alanine--D-alanine ligase [Gammaproteobacteria bacterium]